MVALEDDAFWQMTSAETQQYKQKFADVSGMSGYIAGAEAKAVFSGHGVSNRDLAKIWYQIQKPKSPDSFVFYLFCN